MSWTLTLYFLRRLGLALLVAAALVFALIALVDFVEATRDLGSDSDFSALDLFGLTLLKTPSLVEQTLPFIILFAVIGTLNGLNRRSELIVARAAGVSAWQYLRPMLAAAALFGIIWVGLGNPLAADMLARHDSIRTDQNSTSDRIWLREGTDTRRTVITAQGFDAATRTLLDVTYLEFSRNGSADIFERRFDAEEAIWLPTGFFQLEDVYEFSDDAFVKITSEAGSRLSVPTTLDERDLLSRADPEARGSKLPPVWELPALIAAQGAVGFSTLLPQMKFWKLAALPVLLVGMALIGACVSMRLSREGGTWRLILTGAAVGFAVFFATVFVEAFGEVGTLFPIIAAWTVPVLSVLLGATYLAKLEDG